MGAVLFDMDGTLIDSERCGIVQKAQIVAGFQSGMECRGRAGFNW